MRTKDLAELYVPGRTVPDPPRLAAGRQRRSMQPGRPPPFRARGMPNFDNPGCSGRTPSSAPASTTRARGFELASTRRHRRAQAALAAKTAAKEEATEAARVFRATPLSAAMMAGPTFVPILGQGELTSPMDSCRASAARHAQAQADFAAKTRADEEEAAAVRGFKATPLSAAMMAGPTFVPTLGVRPVTTPVDACTASSTRAQERAQFDIENRIRQDQLEFERAEKAAAREAAEDEARRQHWRENQFRARPVPSSTYAPPRPVGRTAESVARATQRVSGRISRGEPRLSAAAAGRSFILSPPAADGPRHEVPEGVAGEETKATEEAVGSPFSTGGIIAGVKRVIERIGSPDSDSS